jgi:hypothetical protein
VRFTKDDDIQRLEETAMEDLLLDIATVITTGIVIFILALIFGFYSVPAVLCGVAGAGAQASLIRAVYGPPNSSEYSRRNPGVEARPEGGEHEVERR